MTIRKEKPTDQTHIHAVNSASFDTSAEADLVDALRKVAKPLVSLVAEIDRKIIGHILFSPVSLEGCPNLKIMGLAPMTVTPDFQGKGIGSALIRKGLNACRKLDYGAVVVLGYPDYYHRFGFISSARFDINSQYDVPEDVFMVLELEPDYLKGTSGTIRYHEVFRSAV